MVEQIDQSQLLWTQH